MTPFSPNYLSFQWPTSQLVDPVKRFDVVFGTKSVYVAYLFCLVDKEIGKQGILGAGCSEKEVEDLVASSKRPVPLALSDSLSKDDGISLLGRLVMQVRVVRLLGGTGSCQERFGLLGWLYCFLSLHSCE